METPIASTFAGKRVFVTGHTGFKGTWLCEWLISLGATVSGYSLAPPTRPSLFMTLGLRDRLDRHITGNILDLPKLRQAVRRAAPDFVFHLAAQPLVRESYTHPIETFAVNVIGTANLLEALRDCGGVAVVCATTDKCYENREWVHGYREEDPLGGHDPYSASKACAEHVISSYRRSFFQNSKVRIASGRAGNVIGGGDWAKDRIVPDCIRALAKGEAVRVRRPGATRPWQHVLDPLAGYLRLAALLREEKEASSRLCTAFNFGPGAEGNHSVREVVEAILGVWPGAWLDESEVQNPHEAGLLHLSTDKARGLLGWAPVWGFEESVFQTVSWYKQYHERPVAATMLAFTLSQIQNFMLKAEGHVRRSRASSPA